MQEREDAGQITVYGKGGKTRHVLLSSGTWDALTAIRGEAADTAPVFVSRTGGPLSRTQAFRIVRAAAERAGVDKDVSPSGYATPMRATRSTGAPRFISYKPPWGTAASQQQGGICTPDRPRAARNTLPSECNLSAT